MPEYPEVSPYPVLQAATERIAQRVMAEALTDSNYRVDLALEALLELSAVTGNTVYRDYVLEIVARRGMRSDVPVPFEKEPFASLTYALWRSTGDDSWLSGFLRESERCHREMPIDPDGLALHPRGEQRGGGLATVIDAMQEFVCRLVRAGVASGDDSYINDALTQWECSRAVLRDPKKGLWSQGRGWLAETPDALSPGAWSRGHGWLFRSLTASLRVLPPESNAAAGFRYYLMELADAIVPLQATDGMWHAILTRPATDSPPDSSGSAMIAAGLAESVRNGWLTSEKYAIAAQRTFAVLPDCVTPDGIVLSTSPSPGPLQYEEDYLVESFPPGNDHGIFALLFAGVEFQESLKESERRAVQENYCPVCGWGELFEPCLSQYDPFDFCPSCGFLSSSQQRLWPLQQVPEWQSAVLYHRLYWIHHGAWWRSPNTPATEEFHKMKSLYRQTRLQIKYQCPVCGSEDPDAAISDHICIVCGTHFDLNDFPNPATGQTRDVLWRQLRQSWLSLGPVYWSSDWRGTPSDWTPEFARERLSQWEASGHEFGPHGNWYLERDKQRRNR